MVGMADEWCIGVDGRVGRQRMVKPRRTVERYIILADW